MTEHMQAFFNQHLAMQYATQAAMTDRFINRANGRSMKELVDGLRVPMTADHPFIALYAHFYWSFDRPCDQGTIGKWRSDHAELLSHLGITIRSTLLRETYELARDTILSIVAWQPMPRTKAELRLVWWHTFTIINVLVTVISGDKAGEAAKKKLTEGWYGDVKMDFEPLLRGTDDTTTTATPTAPSVPPVSARHGTRRTRC